MADRKSDKWLWLGLGGAAVYYLIRDDRGPAAMKGLPAGGGLGRLGETLPSSISPDADLPDALLRGAPGRYAITVRVVDVPLSDSATQYLSVAPFQTALAQSGIVGRVESVRYLRHGPVSSSNWAADVIDDLFTGGTGSGTKRAVSDRYFEVTLTLGGNPQAGTGMGAVQIGAGAAVVIIGALAIGIAAFFPSARAAVVEGAKSLGAAAGGAVAEAGKGIGVGIAVAGLAAVAVIFLAKKSGASVKTSKFSF